MRGWNLNPTGIPGNEERHAGHKHRIQVPDRLGGEKCKNDFGESSVPGAYGISQDTDKII